MPAFPEGASQKGAAATAVTNREQCRQADAEVAPLIVELRSQGLSLRAITAELTARHIKTRPGWSIWHARLVARILQRAAARVEPAESPPLPDGFAAGHTPAVD
jgi:hypothetical protein